ncbi:unnamed protein product [Auanema sp. JU1783]|nr:unnamed protein product [Auanema sp. JU1783]
MTNSDPSYDKIHDDRLDCEKNEAASRPHQLIRAFDLGAVAILLTQVSGICFLTICDIIFNITEEKPGDVLGAFLITCTFLGVFSLLYGFMRSFYQIIYNALHDQELVSFLENLMFYTSMLISPVNLLVLVSIGNEISERGKIYFPFKTFFVVIIHVILLILSLVKLLKSKMKAKLESLHVLQTSVIAYWSAILFAIVLSYLTPTPSYSFDQ